MRIILVALMSCLLPPVALAQNSGGFTNMLRSLSGVLGAGKDTPPPAETAPIGIRGIDDAPAAKAAPSPAGNDIGRLEGWAASRSEAERMAAHHGLAARTVVFAEASSEATRPEVRK